MQSIPDKFEVKPTTLSEFTSDAKPEGSNQFPMNIGENHYHNKLKHPVQQIQENVIIFA